MTVNGVVKDRTGMEADLVHDFSNGSEASRGSERGAILRSIDAGRGRITLGESCPPRPLRKENAAVLRRQR